MEGRRDGGVEGWRASRRSGQPAGLERRAEESPPSRSSPRERLPLLRPSLNLPPSPQSLPPFPLPPSLPFGAELCVSCLQPVPILMSRIGQVGSKANIRSVA